MEKFHVVIPARYSSKRLPGKVLADIAGKPMLQHVYERALQSGAASVIIAPDDEKVQKAAEGFGAPVCLTRADHPSGTSRLAEVVEKLDYKKNAIVVNLQGDEPLIPPLIIQEVAANLSLNKAAQVATLCTKINSVAELFNPNVVKVVFNVKGLALYFSRAPIPWERDSFIDMIPQKIKHLEKEHYKHIGIYAYRANFLQEYLNWASSPLEEAESLEQLRVLWHGSNIHVGLASELSPLSVVTEEDLIKARALFGK